MLASLVAGGRMQPETGRVLLDGRPDAGAVRTAFALVDTPGVAEPFPVLTLTQVVREELAFAGQRPSRRHVDTVLDELGMREYADTAVQRVPTGVRWSAAGRARAAAGRGDGHRAHHPRAARGPWRSGSRWCATSPARRDRRRRDLQGGRGDRRAAARHHRDGHRVRPAPDRGSDDVTVTDGGPTSLPADTDHLPTEATA